MTDIIEAAAQSWADRPGDINNQIALAEHLCSECAGRKGD